MPTLKKENKIRVWTAIDRNRLKNVAFKIGDGSKQSYLEIAFELEKKYEIDYTDEYEVYCCYKIANKHLRTKSETCLVESFNSSLSDIVG